MSRVVVFVSLSLLAAAGLWWGLRAPSAESAPAASQAPAPAPEAVRRVPLTAEDVAAVHSAPAPQLSASPARPGGDAGSERFSELNRMAIRALEAGDHARACALFEQCVNGVPDEPVFARNLAEALARRAVARREREAPCAPCIADLERALELAPERADLEALLARWRSEAELEEGFWRERSQHFELAYDGDRSEILHGSHRLLEVLERAYDDLALFFGTLPVEKGRAPIRVVLYRREGFGALTGLGDWAGGAFDGTVRVPVEDLEREEARLEAILRHELVHAFVLELGGAQVPGWLNEGLAQWLEPDRAGDVQRARQALAGGETIPLAELEGSLSRWSDEERIARAYAQSLAFTDYLARMYGERIPVALVLGCAEGKSTSESFRDWTRVDLADALADFAHELSR